MNILEVTVMEENFWMDAGGSLFPASEDYEQVKNKQHFIRQEGRSVFKFAVSNMADACVNIMQRNKLTHDDISWLVPHQANMRIIDATANRMGLPEDKVLKTLKSMVIPHQQLYHYFYMIMNQN